MPTPMSIREQCLAAVENALKTVAGFNVFRNLDRAVQESDCPALVIYDGGQTYDGSLSGVSKYVTRISIDVVLAEKNHTAFGPAASAAAAKIIEAVMADPQLGGLAVQIQEADDAMNDPQPLSALNIRAAIGFAMNFNVEYWTKPGKPYLLAP